MYRIAQEVDYYDRFINSIKSPYTKTTYSNALKLYMREIGVEDVNSLITPELFDQPAEVRKIEDQIIDYIAHLRKGKQLSYARINSILAAIFHYYTVNRITINKKYISKFQQQKKRVSKDTAYTREQIHKILEACDLRQKVIILLLASTGMRLGALSALKLSDMKRVDVSGGNQHLYKITVYDMEPEEYYTFCSFECAQAIDEYLAFRQRFGEELKPEAPLIRMKFDRFTILQAAKPKPISPFRFQLLVDEILISAGINQRIPKKEGVKVSRHKTQRSHGFRKFTITQMIKAKLDYQAREYLVGHRHSRGLDEHYDRTTVEDRLQEYLKAVDLLTINEEHILREQVSQMKAQANSVSAISARLSSLETVIKNMLENRSTSDKNTLAKELIQAGVFKPK